MSTCVLINLAVLKVREGDISNFIHRLSASNIEEDCSYIFFLNENGRYFADCFFIQSLQCFISTRSILNRLEIYLKKMDIRNNYKFFYTEEKVCYCYKEESVLERDLVGRESPEPSLSSSIKKSPQNIMGIIYKDPRIKGGGIYMINENHKNISTDQEFYDALRIQHEIAEFDDFIENRSIIDNYGYISKFISRTKGCYPGQELVARFKPEFMKKTVSTVVKPEDIIQILLKNNNKYLVYTYKK